MFLLLCLLLKFHIDKCRIYNLYVIFNAKFKINNKLQLNLINTSCNQMNLNAFEMQIKIFNFI